MIGGIWRHKENILYAVLTIFLLERVRRGWNRIESDESSKSGDRDRLERRQQTFLFGAASLYALPFLLPLVRYIYHSFAELARYVGGLEAMSNLWVFGAVVLLAQGFLSIVLYNLLGIYVERMNQVSGALGRLARNIATSPRVAVEAGANAGRGAVSRARALTSAAGNGFSRAASRVRSGAPGIPPRIARGVPAARLATRRVIRWVAAQRVGAKVKQPVTNYKI